jgi:cytidyltransferase-like protein
MKTIVIVTGGFDPIHSGHIHYINEAKSLGDILVVGVNSDDWLVRKKGKAFLPINERATIMENLKNVDMVITFNDSDGSAINAISIVRSMYPYDKIIFANGGDRTSINIPEMELIDDNLEFKFDVGGRFKKNSSSWILDTWTNSRSKI